MDTPLSDERLAEIRDRDSRHVEPTGPGIQAKRDRRELLAEVDRLRAQVAADWRVRDRVVDTRQWVTEGPYIGRLKVSHMIESALAGSEAQR